MFSKTERMIFLGNRNNKAIISKVSPHTIKKFELIEKYVEAWAQKLLNTSYCKNLVFIDCMCNSGQYYDDNNENVYGTPVRVSKILRDVAGQYRAKNIHLYFNDLSDEKIEHLRTLVNKDTNNFKIHLSVGDGNELLRKIGKNLPKLSNTHFLLIYDPYQAAIDWSAVLPFINNWGEVIINHMVSDSVRAVRTAKTKAAIHKYEKTYLSNIEDLIPYGSDKDAYEKRIEEIIKGLRKCKSRKYFISAFPFFIRTNVIEYNLIHCTSHIEGFKLYKQIAWKTFEGKSSMKNTHILENQLTFDFDDVSICNVAVDEYCYNLHNVAEYIQKIFAGKQGVPLDEIWGVLDEHPIFPSDGFKKAIKEELKCYHGAIEKKGKINFTGRS